MNYRKKISYLIVKKLTYSYAQAQEALAAGKVLLNGEICFENQIIDPYSELSCNGLLVQTASHLKYFAYYKPKGIECTLNPEINQSLYHFLPEKDTSLFYAGRLDKDSEGLLLLTNDGLIYNKVINPAKEISKRYLVKLEKPYENDFKLAMETGVQILGKQTKPCLFEPIDELCFYLEITQGMNRQIRRMCFALGNYVVFLKRIRIGEIDLGEIKPNEFRNLTEKELNWLKKLD